MDNTKWEVGSVRAEDERAIQRRVQDSDEYKSEAVRLVWESGKPLSQIARELGINDNMLHRWSREERDALVAGRTRGEIKADEEELARLRRELARVTAERDFLKRAAVLREG